MNKNITKMIVKITSDYGEIESIKRELFFSEGSDEYNKTVARFKETFEQLGLTGKYMIDFEIIPMGRGV